VKLSLGTVQFGLTYGIANQSGQVSLEQACEVVALARANGIADLDTAIAYGDAEARLGQIGVQGFRVVTKLPPLPDALSIEVTDAGMWAKAHLAASLQRLGVSSVYGLLLHRPADLLSHHGKALLKALQDLRAEGLVQKLGVSIYAPHELESLMPLGRWDLVQAPFNLIDRRLQTSGWLQRLKQDGTEIHTRSAFLQGLLLMPRSAIPSKFAPWTELWDKWHNWLACHSVTAVQACLAYPLAFAEVDHVVVGADNKSQLEQLIGAALSVAPDALPDLGCDDENLINPARWSQI
jgi:aryl-alcohol dehydrogenase-like predicted oxidoreductase